MDGPIPLMTPDDKVTMTGPLSRALRQIMARRTVPPELQVTMTGPLSRALRQVGLSLLLWEGFPGNNDRPAFQGIETIQYVY